MGALFDDLAHIEHVDQVGMGDRRQPVRDDDRGLVPGQPRQSALDPVLGALVQRRGRFVQQQDRGGTQERARDRDPLLLPARQLRPLGAKRHVAARPDQFGNLGGLGGGPDFFVGGLGADVLDVFPDRVVENHDILGDRRKRLAQGLDPEIVDRGAADRDFPVLDIVEPRQQAENGGFPRPGGTDDGGDLLAGQHHVQVVKQRRGRVVAEGDVLDLDIATGIEFVQRVGLVHDGGLFVEQAAHAVQDHQVGLQPGQEIGHRARRFKHQRQAQQKGDDPGAVHVVIGAEHHVSAAADHQHVGKSRHQVHRRQNQRLGRLQANRQVLDDARRPDQPVAFILFLAGNLDGAHAVGHFLDAVHVGAQRVFGAGHDVLDRLADELHHQQDDRHHHHGGGEQQRRAIQKVTRHDYHRGCIAHRIGRLQPDELAEVLGLVDQPQDDFPGVGAFEIGEIQRHQVADQVRAQLLHRIRGHPDRQARHHV